MRRTGQGSAAFPLGFTNVATNYGLPIPPLGCVGHLGLVAIVTYAAAKHRFMDVDVFVMRAAATLLAGVVVALPVAAGLIWMHHLPSGASGLLVAGCLVLAALVSLLMFWRFRSSLEQAVEMSLFPLRRAGRDAIRNLVADLVRLPQSTDLYARIASALKHGLGVGGVALTRALR